MFVWRSPDVPDELIVPGDPGQNSYFTGNPLSNIHAHNRKNKKEKLHRVPPNIVLQEIHKHALKRREKLEAI